MTTEKHIALGKRTALATFLLGSFIFFLYYLTSDVKHILIGYGFVVLAGLFNLTVLISLILKARKDRNNRKKLLQSGGWMLLNLPVLFIYSWIILMLLNTMRITLTNDLNSEITDIQIVGCGGGHIEKLAPGESTTVWVSITGDCSISLSYHFKGQNITETVMDYVSLNMGQIVYDSIDGQDNERI